MQNQLLARIEERLKTTGLTAAEASKRAGLSSDAIRNMRRGRSTSMRAETLERLAEALGTSAAWLLDGEGTPDRKAGATRLEPSPPQRQLPIHGLAAGSILGAFAITSDPVEWVACPAGLAHVRDAYGLIVTGSSMEPAFQPGDYVFLNPNRPPRMGDHVVIQEAREGGMATTLARFEKQTETHVIVTKYNPLAELRIDRKAITALHRVMTMREIVGG